MLEIKETKSGGIVLQKRISLLDNGLTRSWLKVPNSLSRAIERADNKRHKTIESITIKLTVKNHLYSMFGLNQFLVITFIFGVVLFSSSLEKFETIVEA